MWTNLTQKLTPFISSTPPSPRQNLGEGDPELCPFFKNNQPQTQASLKQTDSSSKCPVSGKSAINSEGCPVNKSKSSAPEKPKDSKANKQKSKQDASSSESEEDQAPKGGCPFMGSSLKKLNPGLRMIGQAASYAIPYVSPFNFYLSPNKLDFSAARRQNVDDFVEQKIMSKPRADDKLRSLPWFIQHTVLYAGADYKKVRGLEVCSRFMAYEKLREKGNKHFNKGRYGKAVNWYEKALSLFKWVEYVAPIQEAPKTNSKTEGEGVLGQQSNVQVPQDNLSELDKIMKEHPEFFVTYSDSNTCLHDGEDLNEAADIDMRKSLLAQVYLNLAAAYIRLENYAEARTAARQCLLLSDRISQGYLRLAQATLLDRSCSMEQIIEAKEWMLKAQEMKKTEKIYQGTSKNILKMLNIHDVDEAYAECLALAESVILERTALNDKLSALVCDELDRFHRNEIDIRSRGLVPCFGALKYDTPFETLQYKTATRMYSKYLRVLEFYGEAKNEQQLRLARKELQEVVRIVKEVQHLWAMEVKGVEAFHSSDSTTNLVEQVRRIKISIAEEIHNSASLNFQMLEWVIKEMVKEESEAKKRAQASTSTSKPVSSQQSSSWFSSDSTKWNQSSLIWMAIIVTFLFTALGVFAAI